MKSYKVYNLSKGLKLIIFGGKKLNKTKLEAIKIFNKKYTLYTGS